MNSIIRIRNKNPSKRNKGAGIRILSPTNRLTNTIRRRPILINSPPSHTNSRGINRQIIPINSREHNNRRFIPTSSLKTSRRLTSSPIRSLLRLILLNRNRQKDWGFSLLSVLC